MMAKFHQFLTDESGATAIEYGLIAAGIALAIIATVYSIGPKLNMTIVAAPAHPGIALDENYDGDGAIIYI